MEVNGRRFAHGSFVYLKRFWGDKDEDVALMQSVFDRCRSTGRRVDVVVCSYGDCRNRIEDRVGQNTKMFKCAGCSLANYCARTCQQGDWKRHKGVCKSCSGLGDLQKVSEFLEKMQVS